MPPGQLSGKGRHYILSIQPLSTALVNIAVHASKKLMEMSAKNTRLLVCHCLNKQIHNQGFAAPNRTVNVDTLPKIQFFARTANPGTNPQYRPAGHVFFGYQGTRVTIQRHNRCRLGAIFLQVFSLICADTAAEQHPWLRRLFPLNLKNKDP